MVPSSAASFRDNDSTAQNGGGRSRFKDIVLPPTAATWSVALCRSETAAAAAEMAAMVATPSVVSLTYTTLGEGAEEAARLLPMCGGLCKCTQRSLRTCLYLGSMVTLIISIELALYVWARVRPHFDLHLISTAFKPFRLGRHFLIVDPQLS